MDAALEGPPAPTGSIFEAIAAVEIQRPADIGALSGLQLRAYAHHVGLTTHEVANAPEADLRARLKHLTED